MNNFKFEKVRTVGIDTWKLKNDSKKGIGTGTIFAGFRELDGSVINDGNNVSIYVDGNDIMAQGANYNIKIAEFEQEDDFCFNTLKYLEVDDDLKQITAWVEELAYFDVAKITKINPVKVVMTPDTVEIFNLYRIDKVSTKETSTCDDCGGIRGKYDEEVVCGNEIKLVCSSCSKNYSRCKKCGYLIDINKNSDGICKYCRTTREEN